MTTTSLIAGGTSGVGLSIGRALVRSADNEVLLIGSNPEKGRRVEAELRASGPGKVAFVHLDLTDLAAVRRFTETFSATHESLDLLVHVAGVMEPTRRLTEDGFERTFAVGYLSAVVLATRLAPLLEKSGRGRIAHVGGVARFILNARLDFDDLSASRKYTSFRRAIDTVHAKTVLTQLLARRFASRGIDVNSFHPGAVRSDLMGSMPWWIRTLYAGASLVMTKDSQTGIRVCTAPELRGTSGKYFDGAKVTDVAFDEAYAEQLWNETQRMLAPLEGRAAATAPVH